MNGKRWHKAGAAAALSMLLAAPAGAFVQFGGEPDRAEPAVEYYNAALGEYLVTVSPEEIAALDAGSAPGWARSQQAIAFYAIDGPVAARVEGGELLFAAPVCRYFIPPASHFVSASQSECATLGENSTGMVLESDAAFYAWLPNDAGQCPRLHTQVGGFEFAAVYRLWDSRGGLAHRLTTNKAARDAMVEQGWVSEGNGADGVAMCVPSWTG